jgi:hypothetical protein
LKEGGDAKIHCLSPMMHFVGTRTKWRRPCPPVVVAQRLCAKAAAADQGLCARPPSPLPRVCAELPQSPNLGSTLSRLWFSTWTDSAAGMVDCSVLGGGTTHVRCRRHPHHLPFLSLRRCRVRFFKALNGLLGSATLVFCLLFEFFLGLCVRHRVVRRGTPCNGAGVGQYRGCGLASTNWLCSSQLRQWSRVVRDVLGESGSHGGFALPSRYTPLLGLQP